MRTIRRVFLCFLAISSLTIPMLMHSQAMQFVPIAPCRVLDTRQSSPIPGGTSQSFNLALLGQVVGCQQSLAPATAYSLNVTVLPHGSLRYLTIWPSGQPQPGISLMNSKDGRNKADAAIVLGGGANHNSVSIYVTDTADVLIDVDGYFEPANSGAYVYYPLPTPCRLADTRSGHPLPGGQETDFPILSTNCGIPANAQAYSLNFTAVPHPPGSILHYLTVWPAGQPQPNVSTLNDPTGTIVANAALLSAAGTNGEIAVYPSDTTDLIIDIGGYFGAAEQGQGLAFYALTPCRALDTRGTIGPFSGEQTFNIEGSSCQPPSVAQSYTLNATALPQGRLGYLTLWPSGPQPVASTLNAIDGAYTSNMAIVGTTNGSIDVYAAGTTNLLLDLSGYMAPLGQLTVTTSSLPGGTTGQTYSSQLAASGGEPPYMWSITSGTLPPGLTLSSAGAITGIPSVAGSYPITVQVTDQFQSTASKSLSITVVQGSLLITTTNLPNGTQGVGYSATLGAAGGTPPYTWSVATGTLPAGLNLDPNGGVISGTPTTPGNSQFTMQVTDSQMNTAEANLQININAPITNGSLSGHYAFSFSGYSNGQPVYMLGSYTADGNGNILAGLLDANSGSGESAAYSFTGTYSIQADGLGDMFLNVATLGSMHFSVSLSNVGNGQLILDNSDPSTRGSGSFFVQNTTNFVPPAVGTYAVGTNGADQNFARYAKAGMFAVSGSLGNVSSGEEDVNDAGTLTNRTFTGTFQPPTALNGRGQARLNFSGTSNNYAYYVISTGQYLIMGIDQVTAQDPMTLGSIQKQLAPNFSDAALSGISVLEVNGLNPNSGSPVSDAIVGLVSWNGGGGATLRIDENRGGSMSRSTLQANYNVEPNGRTTTTGIGGSNPILYLYNFNQGFGVSQDSTVFSGLIEQQTATPPVGNQSMLGIYVGGTLNPVEASITDAVSFFQADGNGNLNGIQSYSGSSGSGTQNLSATYSVDASGRAVVTPNPNGNLGGIMYVISAKKVVLLPSGAAPVLSTFSSAQTQ